MRNQRLIADIRDGKAPLVIGKDRLPVQLQDGGIYEMKEFLAALIAGYKCLYGRLEHLGQKTKVRGVGMLDNLSAGALDISQFDREYIDGLAVYEMRALLTALSAGYARLYNQIKIHNKCRGRV